MTYHLFFCPGYNKDLPQLQLLCTYETKEHAILDIRSTFNMRNVRFRKSEYIGKELKMPTFDFSTKFICMIKPIDVNNRLYLVKIREPTIDNTLKVLNEIQESVV